MSIEALSCPKCGGGITVPPDLEFFNCAYCSVGIRVQRGEGFVALKLAQEISKAIQESSAVTQAEIQRLQLNQQLSTAQLQLSNMRAEIRELERSKQNAQTRYQLKFLYQEESRIRQRISEFQSALNPEAAQLAATQAKPASIARNNNRTMKGCAIGCVTYIAMVACFTMAGTLLGEFGIPLLEDESPFRTLIAFPAFGTAILAFVYYLNPNWAIWKPVKRLLRHPSSTRETTQPPLPTITEIANPFTSDNHPNR